MRVIILGSAAGGGVPQWNCACPNCQAARLQAGVGRRTQDSVAVSSDGKSWYLLNVSPDVGRQIERTRQLWPRAPGEPGGAGVRNSPICGAVLTSGDLDHVAGLLWLREWTPLCLYATHHTHAGLVDTNSMLRTLKRREPQLGFRPLALGVSTPLVNPSGEDSGLAVSAFAVEGKLPIHLTGLSSPSSESNVGLVVEDTRGGARLAYVPGAASVAGIVAHVAGVDCLLFDGTFWSEAELAELGQVELRARDLAHLPIGGLEGSLELLAELDIERRLYTHLNNTNPVLRPGARERRTVQDRGWRIAEDGMEIQL